MDFDENGDRSRIAAVRAAAKVLAINEGSSMTISSVHDQLAKTTAGQLLLPSRRDLEQFLLDHADEFVVGAALLKERNSTTTETGKERKRVEAIKLVLASATTPLTLQVVFDRLAGQRLPVFQNRTAFEDFVDLHPNDFDVDRLLTIVENRPINLPETFGPGKIASDERPKSLSSSSPSCPSSRSSSSSSFSSSSSSADQHNDDLPSTPKKARQRDCSESIDGHRKVDTLSSNSTDSDRSRAPEPPLMIKMRAHLTREAARIREVDENVELMIAPVSIERLFARLGYGRGLFSSLEQLVEFLSLRPNLYSLTLNAGKRTVTLTDIQFRQAMSILLDATWRPGWTVENLRQMIRKNRQLVELHQEAVFSSTFLAFLESMGKLFELTEELGDDLPSHDHHAVQPFRLIRARGTYFKYQKLFIPRLYVPVDCTFPL